MIKEKSLGNPIRFIRYVTEIDNIKGMVTIKDMYVADDSTPFKGYDDCCPICS
jgi:hypothetical protein